MKMLLFGMECDCIKHFFLWGEGWTSKFIRLGGKCLLDPLKEEEKVWIMLQMASSDAGA